MSDPTMTDINALRATLAKTTPGEWGVCQCVQLEGDTLFQLEARVEPDVLQCVSTDIAGEEDAAAIVALHNAAPALLDELEALRRDKAALVEALRDIANGRGRCDECGALAHMPDNYVDCDTPDARCSWYPRDPVEVARAALTAHGAK